MHFFHSNHIISLQTTLRALAVVALLLCPALFADTIKGTLDDEPRVWHVIKQGGDSTANFSEFSPGMLTVSIQGHVDKRFATKGTLSIEFTLMNGEMISPPEVIYFHTSRLMPHYGNQDSPEHWELNISQVEGDSAHFIGFYKGTLNLEGNPEKGEPDTLELAVDFDVRASKTEY